MSALLTKKIEDKSIVWFQNSNSYLVVENLVAEILKKLNQQVDFSEIFIWLKTQIDAPEEFIKDFLLNTNILFLQNNRKRKKTRSTLHHLKNSNKYFSQKYYCVYDYIFLIQFENEYLESLIHPSFSHLEVHKLPMFNFNYQVFEKDDAIVFQKNKTIIGNWNKNEFYVFQGKLSMQLLIDIYKKSEQHWMGVFHASAVSNGKESILFLGDSGNGKSTSLALLNANEFDCIADDFVPIDNNKNIYTYPAAISIKKNSIKTLLPYYPELKNSTEYHFKNSNKTVYFLPPKKIDYNQKLTCKAFVFIKYNPEIELEINSLSKTNAFQQLIPDAWISPISKNVTVFLDWFLEIPCYQLTYSNTNKMIETVSKIFSDEL